MRHTYKQLTAEVSWMSKHRLEREAVDREIAHARTGRNHPSVRVVTLERVLAITDAKTEALKGIHRICNRILNDDELTDVDIPVVIKQMRQIASGAWPPIAPELHKEQEA